MKKLILSVFALAALVLSVNAQNTSTTTSKGHVDIVKTIGIASQLGTGGAAAGLIEFGRIALGSGIATVTIDPAATPNRQKTGDAVLIETADYKVSAAKFLVTGTTGKLFGLVYPSSVALGSMNVALTTNLSTPSATAIGASGTDVYIAGTLSIAAGTIAQDVNTADFNVTVTYN
jgi:hypothetical protein